jgi:hypothetical protein
MDYSIDDLIKTFTEHSARARLNLEAQKEIFRENNPGVPLPSYMLDDFNICEAFLSIVKEIKQMKGD